jgi:Ankyrin repeats (3 copies)
MMHSRGYSATKYSTLLTAYYNKPTPLQLASYGVYVADMIRSGNIEAVQEVLNLGLSPNACNIHGESIVHSVCRRSDIHMLDILLQAGCEIQVSDDNGRTPLHDACWAPEPNFPLIEKLLERDKQMLYMMDSRGHLPLSYTRKHHWSEWLQFLQSKKDDYWPRGAALPCNNETGLLFSEPNSRPIRDPSLTPTLSLTQMVAGGKLKPKEARFMQNEFENKQNVLSSCNDDDDDSDCSDDSDDDDNDSVVSTASSESSTTKEELHDSWNFEEMNDILNSLTKPNRAPLAW